MKLTRVALLSLAFSAFSQFAFAQGMAPMRPPPSAPQQPTQPAVDPVAVFRDLQVVVVPGRAFDCNGGRLGWGAGFYDRAIQQMRVVRGPAGMPLCIGVAYSVQRLDEVPMDAHDHRMDLVIFGKTD